MRKKERECRRNIQDIHIILLLTSVCVRVSDTEQQSEKFTLYAYHLVSQWWQNDGD